MTWQRHSRNGLAGRVSLNDVERWWYRRVDGCLGIYTVVSLWKRAEGRIGVLYVN